MPATCFEPTTQGSCQPPSFRANSFRLIHFPQNASANPLESHTFKTKDLKPFRFTHFQKKGRGRGPGHMCPARKRGAVRVSLSNIQHLTSKLCFLLNPLTSTLTKNASASPLDSALTSKRASKSFTSNTYEKHTQGEGGLVAQASACVSAGLSVAATTAHQSRMTPQGVVATPRPLCHNRLLCQRKPLR